MWTTPLNSGIRTIATTKEDPTCPSLLGHFLAMCNLSQLEKQPQIVWNNIVIFLVDIYVLIPEKN